MPTITATASPALGRVRLDIDFTDVPAPWVYVARVNELTGETLPVRTRGTTGTVGTTYYQGIQAGYKITLYDTEAPRDTPVHYVASTTTSALNLRSTFDDTVDPWKPANNATIHGQLRVLTSSTTALGVSGDGVTANPQAQSELVAVPANATIVASVTYTPIAATTGAILVIAYNAALGVISTTTVASQSTAVLVSAFLSGNFVTPASTAFVRLVLQITGTPAGSQFHSFTAPALTAYASSAVSTTVSLPNAGSFWLRNPSRPDLDVRVDLVFDYPTCVPTEGVFFASMDTEAFGARAASYDIANQAESITVARRRAARASTLRLVTRTFADRDRLLALLSPGVPLLWQSPPSFGIPDAYLSCGAVSVDHVLPDHQEQIRLITVPFAVSSSPGGGTGAPDGGAWQDQCGTTWLAANSATWTWQQVSQGIIVGGI